MNKVTDIIDNQINLLEHSFDTNTKKFMYFVSVLNKYEVDKGIQKNLILQIQNKKENDRLAIETLKTLRRNLNV